MGGEVGVRPLLSPWVHEHSSPDSTVSCEFAINRVVFNGAAVGTDAAVFVLHVKSQCLASSCVTGHGDICPTEDFTSQQSFHGSDSNDVEIETS